MVWTLPKTCSNLGRSGFVVPERPKCDRSKTSKPLFCSCLYVNQSVDSPTGFDLTVSVFVQDATANDIPSDTFDVKGFPTIYFRSASGNVVAYEGDRTKEDFINFIEKNSEKKTTSHGDESTKTEEPKKTEESAAKDEL